VNTISLVLFGTRDRYWLTLPTELIGYAEP
jgi:hypothetical protein